MQQGSEEWKQARCGSLGASVIHEIVARTKTGFSTSRENRKTALVLERLTGRPEATYQSEAMLAGTEREPAARFEYAMKSGSEIEEVGLILHPTIAGTHASPDGLIGRDGMLEIKCMQPTGHLKVFTTRTFDDRHRKQMAWQLACAQREWVDFVAYSPEFPKEMQLRIIRYYREDKLTTELEIAAREFLAEVDATVADLRKEFMQGAA